MEYPKEGKTLGGERKKKVLQLLAKGVNTTLTNQSLSTT